MPRAKCQKCGKTFWTNDAYPRCVNDDCDGLADLLIDDGDEDDGTGAVLLRPGKRKSIQGTRIVSVAGDYDADEVADAVDAIHQAMVNDVADAVDAIHQAMLNDVAEEEGA